MSPLDRCHSQSPPSAVLAVDSPTSSVRRLRLTQTSGILHTLQCYSLARSLLSFPFEPRAMPPCSDASQAIAWLELNSVCVISAGELGPDEIEKIVTVISRPLQFIPPWMVNRTKDIKDGKTTHVVANGLDSKLRDSLERLWKIRCEALSSTALFIWHECFAQLSCRHSILHGLLSCVLSVLTTEHCYCFQRSSWSPSRMGSPCPRTEDMHHRPQGSHRWCRKEEGTVNAMFSIRLHA